MEDGGRGTDQPSGEIMKAMSFRPSLKAGALGNKDDGPSLRSGMPFIPRLKSLRFLI